MKKVLLVLMIGMMTVKGYGQMGGWTWMNGDNTLNSTGNFGMQGVFDSLNTPPGLYEACEWTDLQGNFWLFGGLGGDYGANNALWEFNTINNKWAWIKGDTIGNLPGNYGIKGIPSLTNNPGGRAFGSATWVDSIDNLWLFGGWGIDINGHMGSLNDLWKFNLSTYEWTWVSGSDSVNSFGNYGNITISAQGNNPPSRGETNASWTDNNNCLWLFGGGGYPCCGYSDLWKFNISINQWAWMKGPNITGQPAIFGTKGIPNSANVPISGWYYAKWKDVNGNFWLLGNLMWRYNPNTNDWTWMNGLDTSYNINNGVGGLNCISSTNIYPSSRTENRACWTRDCDNFEFWGGCPNYSNYKNDLWNYNINTDQWTGISGVLNDSLSGNFGIKGISNSTNMPPPEMGSIGWKDKEGNLWLFGGSYRARTNAMWRFVPDTSCPLIIRNYVSSSFIAQPISGCNPLTVNFNNNSVNGNSFIWNFGDGNSSTTFNASHTFSIPGIFKVSLISFNDAASCKSIPDSMFINITVDNCGIYIPNIFTPNGDGKNDFFNIIADNYTNFHLIIFNRWGDKVFESTDQSIEWNGKINNTGENSPDGSYYYFLIVKDQAGKDYNYKGFLTLIR